ncbi:hypothetical protein FHG87_014857 [Trinorchestia longiramus]|nr:hypothetical protein FHG87_014857 [Trinorchestia longiramus]
MTPSGAFLMNLISLVNCAVIQPGTRVYKRQKFRASSVNRQHPPLLHFKLLKRIPLTMKTLLFLCLLGLAAAAPYESAEFDNDDGNFGGAVFRSGSIYSGDDDDSVETSFVAASPAVQTFSAPQTVQTFSAAQTFSAPQVVQTYSVPRTVQSYSMPQYVQSYSVPQTNVAKTYSVDITQPQRFSFAIAQPQIKTYSAPGYIAAPVAQTFSAAPSVARTFFTPSVASVAAPAQVFSQTYSVPSFRSFETPVVRRFDFDDDDD